MASEPTDGDADLPALPDDVDAWLDERAEDLGVDRADVVRRLLSAYRAVTDEAAVDPSAEFGSLDERLDRLEADYRENLGEVRRRVVQVKNATEAKAPADHEHPPPERLVDLEEQVTSLSDRVASLAETTERLSGTDPVPAERVAEVESKLTRLARAVVALQRAVNREAEAAPEGGDGPSEAGGPDPERRERLLSLQRLAAREGYRRATCEACGESASVALLPEPACPACGAPVHDIVARGSFRKTPTLVGPEVTEE